MSLSAPSTSIGSRSLRDAIASYRRSQILAAGSSLVSDASDLEDDDEFDEEAVIGVRRPQRPTTLDGIAGEVEDSEGTPIPGSEFADQFPWDDLPPDTPRVAFPSQSSLFTTHGRERVVGDNFAPASHPQVTSQIPLSKKSVSLTFDDRSYTARDSAPARQPVPQLQHHSSRAPIQTNSAHWHGQSTFGQTVFNCTAVLLGIGLLSEPLAFSFTGWILGSLLNLGYGYITCYTAKILARIIIADPHLRSYSDIGRKAFGPKSMPIVSGIFCLELFSVSVVLVTLYADSLHTIIPTYSSDAYKLWGLIILLPSVFLPLSALASFSIVGILSIALLIVVVIYDGLTKREAPGSLWNPADTSFVPGTNTQVGLAFGLLMAGFSGHAVIPSLTMDMADPSQYEKMLNTAFIVATSLYTLIGYAGYIMFGADVHDEISIDLMNTPGYHPVINQVALWLLVLSPLTKFALTTQPLNATIETILGIDHPVLPPEDVAEKPNILAEVFASLKDFLKRRTARKRRLSISALPSYGAIGAVASDEGFEHPSKRSVKGPQWKYLGAAVQRIVVTLSSVAVSILVPEFSTVMSFVGAFAAFLLCVIGPLLAKAQLEGAGESWFGRKLGLVDFLLLVSGIVMAVWGTWASLQDVGP